MSRIREAVTAGPALIPYITAGDPSAEATADYVDALVRGGADIIELGLPFSEPIADGPTIQNAITRALEAGMTPDRYFELVRSMDVPVPLVCMTYYNLLLRYGDGIDDFVATAADAGLDGLIIPDLPVEESDPLRAACDRHGLDLVFIVAPTTRGDRLDRIMDQVSGFVYVQARLGTTGARGDVSRQTHEALARLRDYTVPKVVGFGVSEAAHAREIIRAGADGVVAGSVFVEAIAAGDGVEGRLETIAADLKRGAVAGIELAEPEGK